MKRIWILALLISLGLNLGLGLRLLRGGRGAAHTERTGTSRQWERPAPGDSTAWRSFMSRRVEHLARRLELRPEQVAEFSRVERHSLGQMRERRLALAQAHAQLRELLSAGHIDRPAVRQAMAELGRRQAGVDSLAAETVLGELEVLDAAQRVRYLDFLPDGPGHGPRKGRFGGHRRRE